MVDPSFESLESQFEEGRLNDDESGTIVAKDGVQVTTLRSHWLGQRCWRTQHTFRIGDEVSIDAKSNQIQHTNPLLTNESDDAVDAQVSQIQKAFFEGLAETWPPPAGIPVVRLVPGHPLLAPPMAGFRRHACGVCGHTFRIDDQVLICPCQPHQLTRATDMIEVPGEPPRPPCWHAIHRDPLHGLHCWEAWNPGVSLTHCPVTSRELNV